MAQDEVFAGPMSESVPSSVTSFAHRRPRQGSIASFTYFQEDDESPQWSDEEAVAAESEVEDGFAEADTPDLEAGSFRSHRKSSSFSHASAQKPLLFRHESAKSDTRGHGLQGNTSQKIYLASEDLTIVIAGFKTNVLGSATYISLCVLTAGIAYLVLRWAPRWRIRLVGSPASLRESSWVVIEVSSWTRQRSSRSATKKRQNQWGEFTIHPVQWQIYGHALSTVFGSPGKELSNTYEDDDPPLEHLRHVDYRYMRLFYHPTEDKFVICSGWKDPAWTDSGSLRLGLDADERDQRDQVFGKNIIDIVQKTIPQLLLDEVLRYSLPNWRALTK
ncbi:MAG: hypothetical protein Q9160_002367 [Pyrenula sp. 1 TL-2023]